MGRSRRAGSTGTAVTGQLLPAARAAAAVGAALIVVASWLPWLHSADGFTVVNRLLALERSIDAVPPRWLLAAWYLLPLTAAGVWMLAWLVPRARWLLVGSASVLAVAWAVSAFAVSRTGDGATTGPTVAGLGLALVAGAAVAAVLARPAPRRDGRDGREPERRTSLLLPRTSMQEGSR